MGLQTQLSDFSSESFLILMVMLVAKGVSYLHSLILTFLYNLGLLSPPSPFDAEGRDFVSAINDVVGSGLASLLVLCDQLSINRGRSYPNRPEDQDDADCVVCLNRLARGDHVRRLDCRHVFHKDCFDGWLEHLNFNCPLCRARVVSDDFVESTRRRVAGYLHDWFPPHGA
ncbi:E3 ubiquitin-protein ligase RHA2A-like [Salvia miltiorrhiza]|uniref:E3 ubiquitin-protein ligase RHA2A-like n=1 Tax=Salvia miltiorrhiza TaxID=226208 RepID=UPI0025ACF609|nr:E3 ubiquitin-protein ligase RHA2A-like [Salvia miltiorrhiza]